MNVTLLGSPGCSNCQKLEALVTRAADDLGIEIDMVKVTDPAAIMGFGIMALPGLVVDGRVVVGGRLPSYGELNLVWLA
jgi:small redox-active disulfide protein 2